MTDTTCQPELDSTNMLALNFEEEFRPWNERRLGDLTDVANLLDCLEAWGVPERKVFKRADGTFSVKWRVEIDGSGAGSEPFHDSGLSESRIRVGQE